jgi:hypothetical protein
VKRIVFLRQIHTILVLVNFTYHKTTQENSKSIETLIFPPRSSCLSFVELCVIQERPVPNWWFAPLPQGGCLSCGMLSSHPEFKKQYCQEPLWKGNLALCRQLLKSTLAKDSRLWLKLHSASCLIKPFCMAVPSQGQVCGTVPKERKFTPLYNTPWNLFLESSLLSLWN